MSIKRFYPATFPTLNLNLAQTKQLDPVVSFSRASIATYYGDNRLVQTAQAGQARFNHNPTTGESLGLQIESQSTNLFRSNNYLDPNVFSGEFISGSVQQRNIAVAPDGTMTALLIDPSSAFAVGLMQRNILVVNGQQYSWSLWVKPVPGITYSSLWFGANAGFPGQFYHGALNAATDWIRVTSTQTCNSTGYFEIFACRHQSGGSRAPQPFYVWGWQFENTSAATSFIPNLSPFTGRASTATFYDSAGILQTAASNVARSNTFLPDASNAFYPVGLLLEPAATNLLNHSQTFATSGGAQNNWTDANITRSGSLQTSPDGTANALRVTASANNATIISSAAVGTSGARIFSIFLRRVTGSGAIEYTLNNGSTYTAVSLTSTWRRYFSPATTANHQVGIRLATNGDAIELWGAQLEGPSPGSNTGMYLTSYIPTTSSTATRAADTLTRAAITRSADVAQITGSNFTGIYAPTQGTVLAEYTTPTTGIRNIISFDDNTANERLVLVASGVDPRLIVTDGGVTQANLDGGTITANVTAKTAAAFVASGFAISHNGGAVVTTTSGTMPVVDRLRLGAGQEGNQQNGTIKQVTYWPSRLPDTVLQNITT